MHAYSVLWYMLVHVGALRDMDTRSWELSSIQIGARHKGDKGSGGRLPYISAVIGQSSHATPPLHLQPSPAISKCGQHVPPYTISWEMLPTLHNMAFQSHVILNMSRNISNMTGTTHNKAGK